MGVALSLLKYHNRWQDGRSTSSPANARLQRTMGGSMTGASPRQACFAKLHCDFGSDGELSERTCARRALSPFHNSHVPRSPVSGGPSAARLILSILGPTRAVAPFSAQSLTQGKLVQG